MATYTLKINGNSREVDADPATPVLWVLAEMLPEAVNCLFLQLVSRQLPLLKAFPKTGTTRCKRHGWRSTFPNADNARQVRS